MSSPDVRTIYKNTSIYKAVDTKYARSQTSFMNRTICPVPLFYTTQKRTAEWYCKNYFDERGEIVHFKAKKTIRTIRITPKTIRWLLSSVITDPKIKRNLCFMFKFEMSQKEQKTLVEGYCREFGVYGYGWNKMKAPKDRKTTVLSRASIDRIDLGVYAHLCEKLKDHGYDGFFSPEMTSLFGVYHNFHSEIVLCCSKNAIMLDSILKKVSTSPKKPKKPKKPQKPKKPKQSKKSKKSKK